MTQSEYEAVYEEFKDTVKEEFSKRGYEPHSKVVSDAFNLADHLGRDDGLFNDEYRQIGAKLLVAQFVSNHEDRADSYAARREVLGYIRDLKKVMLNDERCVTKKLYV